MNTRRTSLQPCQTDFLKDVQDLSMSIRALDLQMRPQSSQLLQLFTQNVIARSFLPPELLKVTKDLLADPCQLEERIEAITRKITLICGRFSLPEFSVEEPAQFQKFTMLITSRCLLECVKNITLGSLLDSSPIYICLSDLAALSFADPVERRENLIRQTLQRFTEKGSAITPEVRERVTDMCQRALELDSIRQEFRNLLPLRPEIDPSAPAEFRHIFDQKAIKRVIHDLGFQDPPVDDEITEELSYQLKCASREATSETAYQNAVSDAIIELGERVTLWMQNEQNRNLVVAAVTPWFVPEAIAHCPRLSTLTILGTRGLEPIFPKKTAALQNLSHLVMMGSSEFRTMTAKVATLSRLTKLTVTGPIERLPKGLKSQKEGVFLDGYNLVLKRIHQEGTICGEWVHKLPENSFY